MLHTSRSLVLDWLVRANDRGPELTHTAGIRCGEQTSAGCVSEGTLVALHEKMLGLEPDAAAVSSLRM